MTAKVTITAGINAKIGFNYSAWRIGLTHDLAERKNYWSATKGQDVSRWSAWTADSLPDAQSIETYFLSEKKMRRGEGGELAPGKPIYVYVF